MSNAAVNRQRVQQLWWDLYEAHDYDAVGAHFAADGHYTDMATSDIGGRGPEAIAARLRIGLEPLKEHFHNINQLVAEGNMVVTEHAETWVWDDDNRVTLPFVSMMQFDNDGMILRWWDYWNLGTLMDAAPDWWIEHIMNAASAQDDS